MKNVLIISQHFAPQNIIAAIRFTKMVKYLSKTGKYHFYVICADYGMKYQVDELLQRDIQGVKEYVTIYKVDLKRNSVNRIKNRVEAKRNKDGNENGNNQVGSNLYYKVQEKYVNCNQTGILGNVKRFIGKSILAANDIYDILCEMSFARRGYEIIKQLPMNEIDVMIATYGHDGALMLGDKIKRKYPRLKWIVDYRDPITAASIVDKIVSNMLAVRADRKANYITGASKLCVGSGKYLEKFKVITNGFDRDDAIDIPKSDSNKMTIGYTGHVYYGRQDMSLLFEIIDELIKEGCIDREKISIVYAGDSFYLMKCHAQKYGLDDLLRNKGLVIRKDALTIQKQSDILCVLGWNYSDNMAACYSAKIFEYFMMNKPIVGVVSGDKPDSIFKNIIQKSNVGYCIEEATFSRYHDEAKKWLLNCYNEFMTKGNIGIDPNHNFIEKYSSQNMAKKFGYLIDKCIE